MTILKRATISLRQQKGKTIILWVLVVLLGSLMAGGIIVQQAFDTNLTNLRRSLPAVTSIEAIAPIEPTTLELSRATIHEIGTLPEVSHFDYSIIYHGFGHFKQYVFDGTDMGATRDFYDFRLFGVSFPEMIYIKHGMYDLIAGRLFDEQELNPIEQPDVAPILVSRQLAELNHWEIGSIIQLFHLYFELPEDAVIPSEGIVVNSLQELWDHPYNQHIDLTYEFEIIGIFEFNRMLEINLIEIDGAEVIDWSLEKVDHLSMINLFFAPNWRIDEMRRRGLNSRINFNEIFSVVGVSEYAFVSESDLRLTERISPFWALHDIEDIDAFSVKANELLASYQLQIADLSGIFGGMTASTNELNRIISHMLWSTGGAMVIVLSYLLSFTYMIVNMS